MNTVAVQLTGRGVGAIAVVLVAGEKSSTILGQMAGSSRATQLEVNQTAHTSLLHPETRQPLDDIVIARIAESRYELNLHGGIAVVDAVLGAMAAAGVTVLTHEQAVELGLLGEGLDGEIQLALPGARSMNAARLLAAQSHEGLAAWVRKWLDWLSGASANDLWPLHSAAQWLLARSETLDKLLNPARIAIVGPPNAGKSTLANALLGRPVSITSDVAGTTRDWVDAEAIVTTISGDVSVAVHLVDTAGIHYTSDMLEQESIAHSHEQAKLADVVLLLFDASKPWHDDQKELLGAFENQPLIVVANKTDMGEVSLTEIQSRSSKAIRLSALRREGIDFLMQRTLEALDLHELQSTEPYAFTLRQRRLIERIAVSNKPSRAAELLIEILKTAT